MGEEAFGNRVTCTVRGGIADVRLNRPDKLNALDAAMFDGLVAAGAAVRSDPTVRAVVISGEGRGFCAGLDMAEFMTMAGGGEGDPIAAHLIERLPGRITNRVQEVAHVWNDLPMPTIAAIHGVALGGGLQIALGADLRFVAPDARLSVLEIRWGLIPDMTGTHFLPRLVGLDVAKELTWTGRMVAGDEAVRIGLATQVHDDPRGAALAFAADVAARSPDAVADAKRLLERSIHSVAADQLLDESRTMAALIGSSNQVEAVTAFFQKRDPVYSDRSPAGERGTAG